MNQKKKNAECNNATSHTTQTSGGVHKKTEIEGADANRTSHEDEHQRQNETCILHCLQDRTTGHNKH